MFVHNSSAPKNTGWNVGLYTLNVNHSDHIQIHIIDGVSTVASNLCERKEIVHGHGCQ